MLWAVICVSVLTTVFPSPSIHMLLTASVFKINPLPPSTITTHPRFFGFPVTKDRALHKHTISCAELVNRIRSNVASITNAGTQSTNDRLLVPFCRNFYISTDSTLMNFAFTLFRLSCSITDYRVSYFKLRNTKYRSNFFLRTLYQPRRLVQPFLNWQNENWTQFRNLNYTQNIYQLKRIRQLIEMKPVTFITRAP